MQTSTTKLFKASAKFKLLVYFKQGNGRNIQNGPKVFFSRERLDKKGEEGLGALLKLVKAALIGTFKTAIIYDNHTGMELHKWVETEEGIKYYEHQAKNG